MAMHAPSEPETPHGGRRGVTLRYAVPGFSERWTLPEQPVPESAWHDACVELVRALLVAWLARSERSAAVYRNLAVRVRADRPNVGFDPDVCLIEPAPPEAGELESLQLWRTEHAPPSLVVEVVSPRHPHKDYAEIAEKCAAAGVRELAVFDPKLAGPRSGGGPHLLQFWRRLPEDTFERVAAGRAPAFSEVLRAWWCPIEGCQRLGISEDADGKRVWLTSEQAERRSKEDALRRIAELEAELRRRRGGIP